MRRALYAAAAAALLVAAPAGAKSIYGDYVRAARMLQQWRFDEARGAIEKLNEAAPAAPETRYLRAELLFVSGDYDGAVAAMAGMSDGDVYGNIGVLRPLVLSTQAVTRGFASRESSGGHFVIYYPPGKDEVIVNLAGDTLEAAYAAIGEDMGFLPPEKVRVEILSEPRDLAKLSPLTEKEIETTGTIALCKYGKLMVVSPRATLFGYGWMDTLAHEYTHYVVSRVSHDEVPVWLQEGLARFEQTRWRSPPGVTLGSNDQHLLAAGLRKGRLVSFEEMHPSMAKLPSAEAAALAFAEVYTMVGYLHGQVGYPGLRRAIGIVRDGKSAQRAVGEVSGRRFAEVERAWRKHLRGLDLRGGGGHGANRIRFRKGAGDDDESAGIERVGSDKARKFARLGGILRARGLTQAAALEYEKALSAAPDDGFVAGKLARTYLELGESDKAIGLAEPLMAESEEDAAPATTLGAAYLAKGDLAGAERAFVVALRVSPFDPTVRCGLAEAYAGLGADKATLAAREQRACQLLRSR